MEKILARVTIIIDQFRTSDQIQKTIFFIGSFLICLALYWKTLVGLPIWDDINLWFNDPTLTTASTDFYWFLKYNWPLTALYQKLTFSLWGYQFQNYHILSLFFHMINSLLVYNISVELQWPKPRWIFLLFLFHPASVIAVSWMIQIKTILCFLFAALSFLCFLKGLVQKKWFVLSIVFFSISLCTKSASIPLLFILFILTLKKTKKPLLFIWLLPFLAIGAIGAFRLLNSPVTQEGMLMAMTTTSKSETATEIQGDKLLTKNINMPLFSGLLITKTLSYYVVQTTLPLSIYPVKGRFDNKMDLSNWFRLLALVFALFFIWKYGLMGIFFGGCLLLSPFLGIIPAPYMSSSWVSDQHLYLALPVFLALLISFIDKIKTNLKSSALVLFLLFFIYQSSVATEFYKDEMTFFQTSLQGDPTNVTIANNLAVSYIRNNELTQAQQIIKNFLEQNKGSEKMVNDPYYPVLLELQQALESKSKVDNK